MPLVACIVAIVVFSLRFKKTKENDWLYFIAAFCFYAIGEFLIYQFGSSIIFPFDILFYIFFYITIILYLESKQKRLIKKHQHEQNSLVKSIISLIIDFLTIILFSFVIFYCFDRVAFTTVPGFELSIKRLDYFIYPILDFILFGYYLFVNKSFIMNDRILRPVLTLGFVLWTIGDAIFAFEAISTTSTHQVGGVLMLLGIVAFIFAAIIVKAAIDNSNYTTIDIYHNNAKYNHMTAYMVLLIFAYVLMYIYCNTHYKTNYAAMDIIDICGIGLLFLSVTRQAIDSSNSYKKVRELENDASIDPLTGLFTRRHAFNIIKSVYSISSNFNIKISALMIDVDHFKKYNDTWGHDCGDQVLKNIAKIIKNSIKTSSIICRYGGEEILVIMPGIGKNEGIIIAENVRKNVEKHSFYAEKAKPIGKVTISIGGSTSNKTIVDEFDLIKKADTALYESKKNRNSCFWINE